MEKNKKPMPLSRSLRGFHEAVVTCLWVGYLPVAPGTWGSLVGLLTGSLFLSFLAPSYLLVLTLLMTALGLYSCFSLLQQNPALKDPKEYVVDELIGQWLVVAAIAFMLPFGLTSQALLMQGIGFVLFRFFDIVKPWPVCWVNDLDRYPSPFIRAFAIIVDDILASFYAIACTALVWRLLI